MVRHFLGVRAGPPPFGMTQNLERGQPERAPGDNSRGWHRRLNIFTARGTQELFWTVWEYPDGRPCEVFLKLGNGGNDTDHFLRQTGKSVSRHLQMGMSVQTLISKYDGEIGPMAGGTDVPGIPFCSGIEDLIAKLLHRKYGAPA